MSSQPTPGETGDPALLSVGRRERPPLWVYTPPPPQNAWQRWGRNLVLFVLTVASVFSTGVLMSPFSGILPDGVITLDLVAGAHLAGGLLAILVAHEMGHYLACRYYRVDATLPFFLPLPLLSPVGTLGAFIRIRAPIPHRRALFDIGVAGPIAGFVVCLPVLVLGVLEAQVIPYEPGPLGSHLGEPLLFRWVAYAIHGPIPADQTLAIGNLGYAAWFGLLVTALNLMPISQLDGGHVMYSMLRDRAHYISRVGKWLCVALIYFGLSWVLWAILVHVLGRPHPPTLDDRVPIGRGRMIVGVLSMAIFAICFVPNPIIFSWPEFFEAVGLGHLLGR